MKQEILASIDVLPENAHYWFVRTDGGQYFDSYFKNKFIGIGWNEITLSDLEKPSDWVKEKIFRTQKLDPKKKKDKTRVSDIYNKLVRFKNLQKNDVVVIPSEGSAYLGFGIIADDVPYEEHSENFECPYKKRHKIQWIVDYPKRFDSVDDVFYKIRKSRHSISNVDLYASQIDSAMYSVYKKNDTGHFVVNVGSSEQINWLLLAEVLKDMYFLMEEINLAFGLNEQIDGGTIQIALQSPGFFNLGQKGFSIVLLAAILGSASCSSVEENLSNLQKKKFNDFGQKNREAINKTIDSLNQLQVRL